MKDDDGNIIPGHMIRVQEIMKERIKEQIEFQMRMQQQKDEDRDEQFKPEEGSNSCQNNVCSSALKTIKRRKRVVQFHYPPVSSLRQCPRTDPKDVPNLFYSPEELDQIEYDRDETAGADDVELVAVLGQEDCDDDNCVHGGMDGKSDLPDDDSRTDDPRNRLGMNTSDRSNASHSAQVGRSACNTNLDDAAFPPERYEDTDGSYEDHDDEENDCPPPGTAEAQGGAPIAPFGRLRGRRNEFLHDGTKHPWPLHDDTKNLLKGGCSSSDAAQVCLKSSSSSSLSEPRKRRDKTLLKGVQMYLRQRSQGKDKFRL